MNAISWVFTHGQDVLNYLNTALYVVLAGLGAFHAIKNKQFNQIEALAVPFLKKAAVSQLSNADKRHWVATEVWALIPQFVKSMWFQNNLNNFEKHIDSLWSDLKPQLMAEGLLDNNGRYVGDNTVQLLKEVVADVSSPKADPQPATTPQTPAVVTTNPSGVPVQQPAK